MRCLQQDDTDRGASSVEYALVLFAVAAVLAVTLFAFGDLLVQLFQDSCEKIATEAVTAAACS